MPPVRNEAKGTRHGCTLLFPPLRNVLQPFKEMMVQIPRAMGLLV